MGHKSVAILWIKLIYHHGTQQRCKAGSLEQRTCSSGHTSCKPFTQHMQFRAHLMQPFYAAHAIQGTPHATLLRSTLAPSILGLCFCMCYTEHAWVQVQHAWALCCRYCALLLWVELVFEYTSCRSASLSCIHMSSLSCIHIMQVRIPVMHTRSQNTLLPHKAYLAAPN